MGTNRYVLDAADRLATLSAPLVSAAYSYNTNNGLVAAVDMTGVKLAYTYDILDRVTRIEWRDAATNVLRQFDYASDAVGMITNIVDHNRTGTDQ